MKKIIIEDSALFVDEKFFGDTFEHEYFCCCYDGYAICMNSSYSDTPDVILVKYPKLDVLSVAQKEHILEYRGLYDVESDYIHYGDVLLTYGKIEKEITI